jgi:hypothetical protein
LPKYTFDLIPNSIPCGALDVEIIERLRIIAITLKALISVAFGDVKLEKRRRSFYKFLREMLFCTQLPPK